MIIKKVFLPATFLFFIFACFDYGFWLFKILHSEPLYSYVLLTPVISFLLFRDAMAVSSPHGREKKGSRLILFFVIAMISFFIGWILDVRFLTAAALALYVFSVCGYIYGTCSGVFVYPCFYLIFLYPFEWKLSFYNPLFNRINAKIIKIFFEKLDFPVVLSMENITVKVSNFTLILIDRCSGLQVIVLLFMFLSILPWLNKFSKKQSMVWLLAIPCIVWSVNIIRIFLFTLIGVSEIKALGFMHFLLSLFFLLALYILFRMLFLILNPKGSERLHSIND